jgi:hypothetical protein
MCVERRPVVALAPVAASDLRVFGGLRPNDEEDEDEDVLEGFDGFRTAADLFRFEDVAVDDIPEGRARRSESPKD